MCFYSTAFWRRVIARWSLSRSKVALQHYSLVAGQSRSGTPSLTSVRINSVLFLVFFLILRKDLTYIKGEGHVGLLSGIRPASRKEFFLLNLIIPPVGGS